MENLDVRRMLVDTFIELRKDFEEMEEIFNKNNTELKAKIAKIVWELDNLDTNYSQRNR